MSDTMTLLVIAHTGHVVAGFTRAGGGPDLEAAALAGMAVPVSSIRHEADPNPSFSAWLPASVLEVKTAPLDPRVLAGPQDYVIDGGAAIRIASDAPLSTVSNLTADDIALVSGLAKQKVLVLVSATGDPQGTVRVLSGTYPDPPTSLTLPLTVLPDDVAASLPAGDYGVMVALGGMRLHWTVATVP